MFFGINCSRGIVSGLLVLAGLGAAFSHSVLAASHHGEGQRDDRGGGGQPDPLTVFNQHVELADGELYLLKGAVVMAPGIMGSRKLQPYFNVDLNAVPWLSSKLRKESPLYLIEGAPSFWRAYDSSYGELAAEAHVQVFVTSTGTAIQVISLKPIPELSSIPQKN